MAAVRLMFTVLLLVWAMGSSFNELHADDGQPIAIRNWSNGGTTIETQWGFILGLGLGVDESSKMPLDFDLSSLKPNESVLLSRAPNQAEVTVSRIEHSREIVELDKLKANQVFVVRGKQKDPTSVFVDGVVLLLFSEVPDKEHFESQKAVDKVAKTLSQRPIAIKIIKDEMSAEDCQKIAAAYRPILMIVPRSTKKVGDVKVEMASHNTVAFSTSKNEDSKAKFVSLGDKAYEMSAELKELFARKEAACRASQEFFAKLSVEQMNFKPNNGTHTPRWNPEHMMGRELLFFSQIYNAVDPMIPVMDLNPKQMPKDYQFAHPDWTGAEEAQQMQRVAAFTRRFAYLLDKMDLNRRAKGSRFWSPRALLKQMERHYSEHTENTKKKMELPSWPER
ncbi:MAG: DinB family protein [Planctomycetota bacterium]